MTKIVITQDLGLNEEEKERLNKLGEVKYYEDLPKTPEEWLERCKNADVICTGGFGLKTKKLYELKDKFISVPFVGVGFLDLERLKERNIKVSNCPGCNTEAVSEWIISMLLFIFRKLPIGFNFEKVKTLEDKNITILGKGNIGKRVGEICEIFKMNVKYFKRNDNLIDSIKEADVVINALSLNKSTEGLLDKEFFNSFKKGSCFINITFKETYSYEAMVDALNNYILEKVADDCGSIRGGDISDPYYILLSKHPKIIATPHIAWKTEISGRKENKMMIDNIEAYLKGNPINLIN